MFLICSNKGTFKIKFSPVYLAQIIMPTIQLNIFLKLCQIERLVQNVHQAQIIVSNLSCTPVTNDGEGFLSWFSQSTFSDPTSRGQRSQGHLQLQDDIGPVDANKLCRYLEYTKDYLSKVFQVIKCIQLFWILYAVPSCQTELQKLCCKQVTLTLWRVMAWRLGAPDSGSGV